MWWWSLGNVLCGVVGTFTALAIPAFLPADAIMVSAALASAGPAAMGPQGLGKTEQELKQGKDRKPKEEDGKVAYENAKKAAHDRNLRELEKQRSEEDVRAMTHFFTDESYKSDPNAVQYQPPPRVSHEAQRVLSPQDPILGGGVVHDFEKQSPTSPAPSNGNQQRNRLRKRSRPSSYAFVSFESHCLEAFIGSIYNPEYDPYLRSNRQDIHT